MGDKTDIEWARGDDGTAGATWNPVTGCTEVSPGCDHCYAKTFAERWRGTPGHHFENGFDVTLRPERLDQPLRWRKPRRIFVNSMSDLFHEAVPDGYLIRVFDVMLNARRHTFQVLTKRHARMRSFVTRYLSGEFATRPVDTAPLAATVDKPPANIWLGVSVEDQKWADIRIPALIETPAAVRFLSCEPLLGEVSLDRYLWLTGPSTAGPFRDYAGRRRFGGGVGGQAFTRVPARDLHWVIVGGESGRGARPMDSGWADRLVWECGEAQVPVFVKQMGSVLGRELGAGAKGGDWDAWPADLRVREFPRASATAAVTLWNHPKTPPLAPVKGRQLGRSRVPRPVAPQPRAPRRQPAPGAPPRPRSSPPAGTAARTAVPAPACGRPPGPHPRIREGMRARTLRPLPANLRRSPGRTPSTRGRTSWPASGPHAAAPGPAPAAGPLAAAGRE